MRLNTDWSHHWAEDGWTGQGSRGRMGPSGGTRRGCRPGGGESTGRGADSMVAEVTEDFDRACRRDQMRSGCPPRLRNILIGLANLVVLVFILVVINKIYYEHDEVDTGEVCYAEDMK